MIIITPLDSVFQLLDVYTSDAVDFDELLCYYGVCVAGTLVEKLTLVFYIYGFTHFIQLIIVLLFTSFAMQIPMARARSPRQTYDTSSTPSAGSVTSMFAH